MSSRGRLKMTLMTIRSQNNIALELYEGGMMRYINRR